MALTGILFAIMYCCLFALADKRHIVAAIGAAVFILLGQISLGEAIMAIDYNVLLMIAGSMGLVYFFIESKMPNLISDWVLSKLNNACAVIVALALLSGIISAFIDNVATVLMMAPIALSVAERLKISPIPIVIAVAVSSNLQGAATLVGDTTSLLLSSAAGMDFFDFFVYNGKIGMFFVVQAGAIVSCIILWFLFRDKNDKVEARELTKVEDMAPTYALVAMLVILICCSFLPNKPALTNGIVCFTLYVILAIWETMKTKTNQFVTSAKEIDFKTLIILSGVFIAIAAVEKNGVLQLVADTFANLGGGNVFVLYSLILWASVIISAFIDNIPYVAAMLPVVSSMSTTLGIDPTLLYFGLLCGATLGGNLTPVGASANITGIGILTKAGHEVSNNDFFKIGIPFTLSAVTTGYIMLWLIWGM